MKISSPSSLIVLLAVTVGGSAWGETPKTAPAKSVPARSVFLIPANGRDGRDPFYPESTRVFQVAEAGSKTVEISSLAVKGFYRDAKGALVIINNHTFAVGDEGDVITTGGRVHIRCLEIRANAVVIDINGQKHELNLSGH